MRSWHKQMTKKELYRLSVKLSQTALQGYFGAPETNFTDMECNPSRKRARQNVYNALIVLFPPEEGKK
jgi:hypothetical protein